MLYDSIALISSELVGISDLEGIRVDDSHFVDRFIDSVRLDSWVIVAFSIPQLHALDTDESGFVTVLKFVFLIA